MSEELQYVRVTTKLVPLFYQQFHCLMGDCQDTCCCGWRICFNKKDYLTIRRAGKTPELEELTQKAMKRIPDGERTNQFFAEFVTDPNHPCPYQNQEGLCRLQLGCGEHVLPEVCREFPRKKTDTTMGRLYSLTTGCEAVVKLLWDLREGIDFVEEELPSDQRSHAPLTRALELQPILITTTIDILQAQQFSIPHRLIILGMALNEVRQKGFAQLEEEQWRNKVETWLNHPELLSEVLPDETHTPQAILQQFSTVQSLVTKPYFMQIYLLSGGTKNSQKDVVRQYLAQTEHMQVTFGDISHFWENVLVDMALYLNIPDIQSETALWNSYVDLCNLYGLFRYVAAIAHAKDPSVASLFRAVVQVSRVTLHSSLGREKMVQRFDQNQSNSLAHMALLVQI